MTASVKFSLLLFFSIILFSVTALPQQSKFTGVWKGDLHAGISIPLVFHVAEEGGALSARMDSPSQNAFGIKADAVTVKGDSIYLDLKSLGASYSGAADDAGSEISGVFVQRGMKFPLVLEKSDSVGAVEKEINYSSIWQGDLKVGEAKINLIIKFLEEEGKPEVLLDSPTQGAANIAGEVLYLSEDSVHIKFDMIKAEYTGSFEENEKLNGVWKQGNKDFELNFSRVSEIPKPKRPQEPVPPFPYDEEEVSFYNDKEQIKLSGTFTKPRQAGKFPAVVLVSGSGPQDRDENIFGHKLFKVIADHLTRHGIAVLRYDDRGVGSSEGVYEKAVTDDFTDDAEAAVKYLTSRDDVDADKIGIIGHSEGGMIAPMVSVNNKEVDFLVLLAAPGTTCREILIDQSRLILSANGVDSAYINRQEKFMSRVYDIAASGESDSAVAAAIKEIYPDFISTLSEEEKAMMNADQAGIDQLINQINNPWFRQFVKCSPAEYLEKLTVPVIALNGANDLQVPADKNLEGIKTALEKAGNKNYEVHKLEGLNHLFQPSSTGSPLEYAQIEETFSTKALEIMTKWIIKTNEN